MEGFLICISLLIISLSGYIVWPSRYNVFQHLSVGGSFVSIVVPALILTVHNNYPDHIVNLYVWVLVIGTIAFLPGLIVGFAAGKDLRMSFSFDVMAADDYEKKAVTLTRNLMLAGVVGMIVSYLVMGFVPMFAEDPISAKLFRGSYQEPYIRVAILYRASFYILATIMPIACIIWYKYRTGVFLFLIGAALVLMAVSLTRAGAFMGIVLAFTIIMSFKSNFHFLVLMIILICVFVLSSYFYYLIGVRAFTGEKNIWEIITAGTPDIPDHLDFMTFFDDNPVWTWGRTIYGGLIPGHYEWNPAVYTLIMVNPDKEINEIGSGGLRLPLPLWGYVSFQWPGVVLFSVLTGFLNGMFLGMVKDLFRKYESIVIRTIIIVALGTVAAVIVNFTQLNMYTLPPAFVSLFYLFRFKWKREPA